MPPCCMGPPTCLRRRTISTAANAPTSAKAASTPITIPATAPPPKPLPLCCLRVGMMRSQLRVPFKNPYTL